MMQHPKIVTETAPWRLFKKDPGYQALLGQVPAEILDQAIDAFGFLMQERWGEKPTQWTASNINQALHTIFQATPETDDDEQSFLILWAAVSTFTMWQASRGNTVSPYAQLDTMFQQFESEIYDYGDDDLAYPDEDDEYDQPGLPLWQERTATEIKQYMHQWVDDFSHSPKWQKAPDGLTVDSLQFFVETLTERAYDEYRKTPKTWSKAAIVGVLTGYFVTNVTFQDNELELVGPALEAFVSYLGYMQHIRPQLANSYARWIAEGAQQLVELDSDSSNYGAAKQIGVELQAAGVDVDDPAAVQAFIDTFNQKTALQRMLNYEDFDSSAVYFPAASQLTRHHVAELDGRKWTKAWATRVHDQSVRIAQLAWSDQTSDKLRKLISQQAAVDTMISLFDDLYATKLLTPPKWTQSALNQWVQAWAKRVSKQQLQAEIQLIKFGMNFMVQERVIGASKETSIKQLIANIVIPGSKKQGKIISFNRSTQSKK